MSELRKSVLEELGTGLHPLQDIDAHCAPYVKDKFGVKMHGGDADNPTVKPERYQNTLSETEKYFNDFLRGVGE